MPASLLGPGLLGAGRDLLGQRVARRGGARVDGAAALAALGRLQVQFPADLDDLAVHGDDPGGRVDLAGGQGEQLALPQPAVGRGVGHQLMQVPAPPGGQGLAEPGDIGVGGDLGGVDELRGFPGDADQRGGRGRPPACQCTSRSRGLTRYPAVIPAVTRADRHRLQPGALPGGGRGVDDLLHVGDPDVLAGDRGDDRGDEPGAQPPLGIGVLAGPLPWTGGAGPGTGTRRSGPRRAAPCAARQPAAAR